MQKLRKMYYDKYLSDMSAKELQQEQERIDLAIHLLAFVFAMVVLGGVL